MAYVLRRRAGQAVLHRISRARRAARNEGNAFCLIRWARAVRRGCALPCRRLSVKVPELRWRAAALEKPSLQRAASVRSNCAYRGSPSRSSPKSLASLCRLYPNSFALRWRQRPRRSQATPTSCAHSKWSASWNAARNCSASTSRHPNPRQRRQRAPSRSPSTCQTTGGGAPSVIELRANPGPQEAFLATPADIAIYGGSAGGGKSWGLVFDTLSYVGTKGFSAIYFRRTYPELDGEGGLWNISRELYPHVDGVPREGKMDWRFPSGASISMRHLQHEWDVFAHQGKAYCGIYMDEMTHFLASQFWY